LQINPIPEKMSRSNQSGIKTGEVSASSYRASKPW
jgi:hypothetical protein